MKRIFFLGLLFLCVLCGEAFSQEPAPPPAPEKPATSRSLGTSRFDSGSPPRAKVEGPLPVDSDFLDSLSQLRALARELAELRSQVKALEGRLAARNQEIRQWIAEHQVPGDWRYDEAMRAFVAPATGEPAKNPAGPATAADEKAKPSTKER